MTVVQASILGVIQGFTEFLPVSSSGHLIFFPQLFGWTDQGIAFDVVVHLGTLVAVVLYFRKTLLGLLLSFFSKEENKRAEKRLAWFVMLSVIPAGIVGYLLDTNSRSATVVAVNLIVWGVVLGIADHGAKKREKNAQKGIELNTLGFGHVLFISCAQVIALLPGTSRSGITMTAGLFVGLKKETAATFSFLMSVPVIFSAGAFKTIELFETGVGGMSFLALGVGFITAALSGLIAIRALMSVITRWSFFPFVVYRVAIGILILFVLVL